MSLVLAVAVALGLAHLVAARPWDSAGTSACGDLFDRHTQAQVAFLESGEASTSDLGAARDTSFAELGMDCGWEEAQAADMGAYVQVLQAGGTLPPVE